jgi:hypothetical protein
MKMKNLKVCLYFLIIGLFTIFSTVCVCAETESDATGDVYHYSFSQSKWSWQKSVDSKPDIDITEISYSADGDKVTLNLKVNGDIVSSENVYYWAYYNSSDSAYYLYWTNGEGFGIATDIGQTGGSFDFDPDISVSDGTITAVFDIIGETDNVALWGWAAEYTNYGDQSSEWWGDWAPISYAPFSAEDILDNGEDDSLVDDASSENEDEDKDIIDNGEDDTEDKESDNATPGFEFVFVILTIFSILIIIRNRIE